MADIPQSMANPSRQSGTRACAMCVKAKAKCMSQSEIEGVCQRCHRLKKQCFLNERPSRKRTRTSKPTRVAQLEQKLDGLFSLLTSNQSTLQANPSNQVSDLISPRSPVSLDSSVSTMTSFTATPPSMNAVGGPTTVKDVSGDTVTVDLVHGVTLEALSFEPDEQEAEALLLEYKRNLAEQFPFIVIHQNDTSKDLRRERPFLWKAIMVAASHEHSSRQLALGARLMKDLTTHLLFKAEKSLDLLQALLVFIAWYHYHTLVNPQLTNLLHLAKALINSMGLSRTQTAYDQGRFFLDGHDLPKTGIQSSSGSDFSRSDGWRAIAGCFYLATVISASCRGLELQFNTTYILECCQKLEKLGEYQSDISLVQLVRLQEIRYRMGRSFPYDDCDASRRPDAPVEMFVRAWQKELETIWATFSTESQQNWLLLANYHTIKISLYEIDLSGCPMCQPQTAVKVIDRIGRLEFIYASLLATRSVLDVYSSVPVERLSGVSFTLWVQFNHALLNGIKLLTIEANGWDLQHARSVLTFPDILHSQVKGVGEIISRRGLVFENAMDGKDVFVRFLMKLHKVLRWYDSSRASRIEPEGPSDQPSDRNGCLETAGPGESFADFDDAFWQNLFDDNWMLVGDGLST